MRPRPVKPQSVKPILAFATLAAAACAAAAQDRADIDRTQIIGNRELPKVLYIVPWKKPLPGELSGRPVASVLDEALAPVDRDVFRRQVRYHAQTQAQLDAPKPGVPITVSAPPPTPVPASPPQEKKP